jgi:predicted Zn-dependent peptidase
MSAASLRDFRQRRFVPERTIVAVAGAFDPQRLAALFEERLAVGKPTSPLAGNDSVSPDSPPLATFQTRYTPKPLEQVHFCFGTLGPRRASPERYAMGALNLIHGGGMASRLFQEVREKRGLAYAIGSYANGYLDTGYYALGGGTTPENLEETLDICWRETRRLGRENVSEDELRNAKDMMRASLLLGLEGVNARMFRLAENEIYHDREIPIEETLKQIEGLTVADVRACAERYLLDQPVSAAYIGPPEAEPITRGRERF